MHALLLQKNTLLFDLDGTLVDSVRDIAPALNIALSEHGFAKLNIDQVRAMIGRGSTKLVELAIESDHPSGLKLSNAVHQRFIEAYGQNVSEHTQILTGVPEFLVAMKAAGKRMACVTNKPEALAVQLLDHLQLSSFFETVIGGDTAKFKKPDPAPLFLALERMGSSSADALMFGDSIYDLQAAESAGMPCFVISGGYNQGQEVILSAPNHRFDRYAELLS
jgi:phosphoglycolate phosphatase